MAATTKKGFHRTSAPTKKAISLFSAYSKTDVDGSYTGKPKGKNEKPVQDVDDL